MGLSRTAGEVVQLRCYGLILWHRGDLWSISQWAMGRCPQSMLLAAASFVTCRCLQAICV